MDIYGVKKYKLEQVYLQIWLRSLMKPWLSTIYLDGGIQYKSIR